MLHLRPVLRSSSSYRISLICLILFTSLPAQAGIEQLLTAEFALQRQHPEQAIQLYQQAALATRDIGVLDRALALTLTQGDIHDALRIAQHWVDVDPNHVPALFYLAHLALRVHDYPLAAQTLDRILAHDPSAALDRILIGIYPENTADRQALLHALTNLNTRGNPSLLVLHAGLLVQGGQLNDALAKVDAALASKPDVTAFITLKASILMQLQTPKQVRDWLHHQSRRLPNNKSLQLFEVRYLLNQHEQTLALSRLDQMARNWPEDGEITLLAALVSIDQQRPLDAEKYLLQLLTQDAYIDQAYYYLGVNAERLNRPDVAEIYLQKVQSDDLYRKAQRKLVLLRMMRGRLDDALAHLTQQRVDHPEQSDFLYLLQAQLLRENGQRSKARMLLDEALSISPDQPELIYARVLLLEPNSEGVLLESELEHLLSLQPDNATYLNAYAYALAEQNRRLDDAWRLVERADHLSPNQPAILDTMGYVALRQNHVAQAITILQRAYQLDPSVNIGLRLADALQKNQQMTEYQALITELKQRHLDDPRLAKLLDANEGSRKTTLRNADHRMVHTSAPNSPVTAAMTPATISAATLFAPSSPP